MNGLLLAVDESIKAVGAQIVLSTDSILLNLLTITACESVVVMIIGGGKEV